MEQQYGLSPRGKPAPRKNGNPFIPANFGPRAKSLSASHEDLTRLDRHQPIIIQNFELLSPSQLKFRRPSLSTANLYLSHASLSRSGGNGVADERPATVGVGINHSQYPGWSESIRNDLVTENGHINGMPEASPSPSSGSSSSKQRDKRKHVTFSSQNTMHPYEPDQQTLKVNPKYRKADFLYPFKTESFRQFLPFQHYSHEVNENNRSIYSDNKTGYNGPPQNDTKAYNGHWVPGESLSTPKSRAPQRSALKQTSASSGEGVSRVHLSHNDQWSTTQVNGPSGQRDTISRDNSRLEGEVNGVMESSRGRINDRIAALNDSHTDIRGDDTPATHKSNDESFIEDNNVSTKSIPEVIEAEANRTARSNNSNLDIDVNQASGEDSLISGDRNHNDSDNESDSFDSNIALPEHDFEHYRDVLAKSGSTTWDSGSKSQENVDEVERARASSFYDIFSTYDVPDNEYNKHDVSENKPKKNHKEVNNNGINNNGNDNDSISLENQNTYAYTVHDYKHNAQSSTHSSTEVKTDADSSSLQPKVIRLKFLADSDTQRNNSLKNITNSQEPIQNESNHKRNEQTDLIDGNRPSTVSQNLRNSATSRNQMSATSRQLKTKSTIEAVDLSTLAFTSTANERPHSQGDVNAQFLMNMYSSSGDRKASDEIDHENDVDRPPSRKPTDRRVTYSVEEYANHLPYRDPLTSSSRGRHKERQFLASSKHLTKAHTTRPLLRNRATSAHAMMVRGNGMLGKERVVAAEKFLIKSQHPTSADRTALNRQLEQLIVSRSVSSRVKQTMERSRSNLM